MALHHNIYEVDTFTKYVYPLKTKANQEIWLHYPTRVNPAQLEMYSGTEFTDLVR